MSHRRSRVEEQIQREVSRILLESLRDPRVSFLSVTAVRASADLRHARVYVSILGDAGATQRTLELLRRASAFVRRELGSSLHMRHVPELEFRLDEDERRGSRVEEILSRLHEDKDSEE